MSWLGGRMKWPFAGNGAAVAELEREPEIEVSDDGKPHLMMLAADASGLASFKLFDFPGSEAAVEFIQRSFGGRSDTGLIAFWAMTEKPVISPEPGADTALEVMVMIRDDIRNDVVYPFSFTDIETAHSFVRHEIERGLDPSHVLLYWAAPVQLGITAGGEMGLFPKAAPTGVDHEAIEIIHPAAAEPAAEGSEPGGFLQSLTVSVAVEAPFVSTGDDPIEALFVSAEEPAAEPVSNFTDAVEEEIEELAVGGDEANPEETVAVSAEEVDITQEAIAGESEVDVAAAREDAEAEAAEAAEEETTKEQVSETVAEETTEDWNVAADDTSETFGAAGAVEETPEPVAAIAIEQWVSDGPMGTEFPAGRVYARSEAGINDVSDELQRVLRVRRWEESTEPFRGFESPPGRF